VAVTAGRVVMTLLVFVSFSFIIEQQTHAELKFGAPKNDVPKKALQFDNWCEKMVES